MERIFDFPRRVRFVAANVAASDTVKGSHIQRNPLSMGALLSQRSGPESRVSQSPKEKKTLCPGCNSVSWLTLVRSVPNPETDTLFLAICKASTDNTGLRYGAGNRGASGGGQVGLKNNKNT